MCGRPHPPDDLEEWLAADENSLRYAQCGAVFRESNVDVGHRLAEFRAAYYPRDVWLWRIASKLLTLWHYGSYNLCSRHVPRGDGVATLVGQGRALIAAMQLVHLFNRRFAPYWKWLHRSFIELPSFAPAIEVELGALAACGDLAERGERIGRVCEHIRTALRDLGILPDAGWRNFLGAFEVVETIGDSRLRAMDLWTADRG
jgi:hypothetical protein